MSIEIEYNNWIQELKNKIKSAQIKASIAVNEQMIMLYWDIGKSIVEKQTVKQWGSKVVDQMAKDLKRELPDTNGFSRSNLFAMRKFYLFYKDNSNKIVHQAGKQSPQKTLERNNENEIVQQAAGQITEDSLLCKIPWWHHVVILSKCQDVDEALFYIQQTIENNWSRNILEMQLESKLIQRVGKTANNFELTLPKLQSDLAIETIKDPYKFDFLTLEKDVQELEFERKLTENITKFLIELGKGFAFVGRQYVLQVGKKERKIDLLFYHLKMHCYIVIDLKMSEFEPEYAGKMNFYLSAVDNLLKTDIDNPSIGLILCKSKNSIDVEYTLQDMSKPMGISEFTFNELPKNIKNNMPTVSELENELKKLI